MQHPFDGVKKAGQETPSPGQTRRSVLGRLLGAVAALLGAAGTASAQRPGSRPTTLAYGEEGGRPVTTYAVGEEGGRPPRRHWATTYAWGEEGGRGYPPAPPPSRPPTTLAYGEEGGRGRY